MKTVVFLLIFCSTFWDVRGKVNCPAGSEVSYNQKNCWFFVNKLTTFKNANVDCQNLGGNLVSVHDAFTNMMLAEKARRNFLSDAEFLIGGYKAENSTIWGWSDESIFNYKDWAAGEPINSTDEKCMISSVSYGFWYTTSCNGHFPFVCETIPPPPTTTSTTTSSTTSTPSTTTSSASTTTSTASTTVADTSTVLPPTTATTVQSSTVFSASPTTPPSKSCANVIFIGEMTEIIGQQRKESFLNATKTIAEYLNANFRDVNYAIATFGNDIYRSIQLQSFSSFHSDLLKIINNVTVDNFPNGQQTFIGSTLKQLVAVLSSNNPRNSLVLSMGQTQQILDLSRGDEIAKSIADLKSEVYVLDATSGNFTNDYIFKDLVGGQQSKLANLTIDWKPEDITKFYSSIFQTFIRNVTCN